jgi:hypothetical protein
LRTDNGGFQTIMGHRKCPKDPEQMRVLALTTAASSNDENTSRRRQNKRSQKHSAGAIFSSNSFGLLEVDMSSDADDDDFIADNQSMEPFTKSPPTLFQIHTKFKINPKYISSCQNALFTSRNTIASQNLIS